MSVLAWLKLTVCLWLLRKAVKIIGWLLLVAGAVAAWPVIHARWPLEAVDLQLFGTWWTRINDGSAAQEPSVYLVLICWLMWITGAWLSWGSA